MTLLLDDDDRYGRQRLISWWDQRRLATSRVLVVGAGALGNEVLKNLALVGVGYLAVVDFDRIELSNLARSVLFRASDRGRPKASTAAAAVRELNPEITIEALDADILTDVGLGWFRDMDLVVGCLDNREARLWVNRVCWRVNRPWIDGAIQEINGVVKVFQPPDSACYECTLTENDFQLISLRYSCPQLPRDDLLAGKVPTTPSIASIVGGLQAQEALKLLHGLPTAAGHALVFNGVANNFYRTQFSRREDCLSHEPAVDVIRLGIAAARHTVLDLLAAARATRADAVAAAPCVVRLERDLVVALHCDLCQRVTPIFKPRLALRAEEAVCEQCGAVTRPELVYEIAADSPLATRTLAELGIPPYDLVTLRTDTEDWLVLLASDAGPSLPCGAPRSDAATDDSPPSSQSVPSVPSPASPEA